MQRQLTFGGGVSPRGTHLRGQSIIEYVLIIAIIGLVIVFAGPGVAGAIRNQFNLVGNTVNNGTVGGTEGGGVSGGGSTGADSATVQAAVAKDAKDWTLDEQEAVPEQIQIATSLKCQTDDSLTDCYTDCYMDELHDALRELSENKAAIGIIYFEKLASISARRALI